MFELVKFNKAHLQPMLGQRINPFLDTWVKNGHAETLENGSGAFTGLVQGEVAICGGTTIYWPGRGHLWAVFNESFKNNFLPVFRGVREYLAKHNCPRLEMAVPCDFHQGHRRALLLGFRVECQRAEKYLPGGQDCTLYARIKHGL